MKPFDPTKPCQYRNGEKARILCTDANEEQPIYAQNLKTKKITKHLLSGSFWSYLESECQFDLINIPSKKTVELWVNVDNEGTVICSFNSFVPSNYKLFARKKITFEVEEGEGL